MTSPRPPGPEPDPPPVRTSSLQRYIRCGVAFRRDEVEHEGRPPTTPLIRGTAVHRGVAIGLLQQVRTGDPAPADLMEDAAASEVDRARRGGATLTAAERGAGAATTFGALKDDAVRFAGSYARLVAPTFTPVHVERRIVVALPGFRVAGTLDAVARDAQGEVIRDLKTRRRAPQKDEADRSVQLSMYDLLRAADTGDPRPQRVALDVLVQNRSTREVAPRTLESVRGPRDRVALINRVRVALDGMRAGIYLPADPERDWFCSESWCPYWSDCPYAVGPARAGTRHA